MGNVTFCFSMLMFCVLAWICDSFLQSPRAFLAPRSVAEAGLNLKHQKWRRRNARPKSYSNKFRSHGSSTEGLDCSEDPLPKPKGQQLEPAAKAADLSLAESFRKVVMDRNTARAFKSDPIPDGVLAELLLLAQRAPSGFNAQPYVIIVVKDEERKRQLSECMMGESNKRRVLEAPVTAVFAADLANLKKVPQIRSILEKQGLPASFLKMVRPGLTVFSGGHRTLLRFPSYLLRKMAFGTLSLFAVLPKVSTPETWATKNVMLAVENYLLAAVAHGLSTSPMEGFDMRKVKRRLGIPRGYTVPIVVATGYSVDDMSNQQQSLRFPPEQVFFQDSFGKKLQNINLYDDKNHN